MMDTKKLAARIKRLEQIANNAWDKRQLLLGKFAARHSPVQNGNIVAKRSDATHQLRYYMITEVWACEIQDGVEWRATARGCTKSGRMRSGRVTLTPRTWDSESLTSAYLVR